MTIERAMMQHSIERTAERTRQRRQQLRRSGAVWQRGFTLLELIVVIAITLILLGLLFGPLIQGMGITRRARAIAVAQDSARSGLALMRRELAQAAYVFDNTGKSVYLPLQATHTADANRLPASLLGAGTGPYVYPLQYAKVDFIPAARATGVGVLDPTIGRYVDPTTGAVGSNLRFPLAPGTHVVRYFVGLRQNYKLANGAAQAMYYANPYEFPHSANRVDADFNPFILYRAEFDVTDQNVTKQLFDTSRSDWMTGSGADQFNDPNFFYDVTNTAPNGHTYAENWAKVARPVMDAQNMDLLVVRRTAIGAIDINNPFRTLVTFQPSTVTGETATPGFLSNDASETPGAVPTMYTARYGDWTLPITVTFVRASTINSSTAGGSLTVKISTVDNGSGQQVLDVEPQLSSTGSGYGDGSLHMSDLTNFYCTISPSTGLYFVKAPDLAFAIDPIRGRIITGFPPYAGTTTGDLFIVQHPGDVMTSAWQIFPASVGKSSTPGGWYNPLDVHNDGGATSNTTNFGELVPAIFRIDSLDTFAAGKGSYPTNQGFLNLHLLVNQSDDPSNPQAGTGSNYYTDLTTALAAPDAGGAAGNAPFPSPLAVFGAAANNPGVMVAAGTERLTGPDSNVAGAGNDTAPYLRLPLTAYASGQAMVVPTNGNSYANFTLPSPQYYFEYDLWPYDAIDMVDPMANPQPTPGTDPGFPAVAAGGTQKEVRATFLWQNNYARTTVTAGGSTKTYAIDANGNYSDNPDVTKQTMGPVEADVVKLDYATRSILNVNVGSRVYDAQSGAAQLFQLNDKIQIINLGR